MHRIALALASLALLAGCSHLHWPFRHRPPPAPPRVHELLVSAVPAQPGAAASAPPIDVPQYWNRYTLVLDLTRASGSGAILVQPLQGETWPVRVALRVLRGAIGELDVRAEQRLVIPVDPHAGGPVELTLPPSVLQPTTAQMRIDWGPVSEP